MGIRKFNGVFSITLGKIFVSASLLFMGGTAWAKDIVKICYFDVPPHVFYDASTKKVSGAVFDLLQYLAPEMDVEFVWDESPSNIPREIEQLGKGESDAAAVFIYNPNDLANHAFSDKAYYYAKDSLIVKQSNPLQKIVKIDDILKLKIGYAPETYVSNFMSDKRIQWEFVNSTNINKVNLNKVLTGRLDAAYAPDHSALIYEIGLAKAEKTVKLLYTPEPPVPFHIGFSLKKPDIKKRFDAAFAKKDGAKKYLEFLAKYTGTK